MADPTPRVLLIGMMGAGKTTIGHAIAARTGWPYLDNDLLVERDTGRPTRDLWTTMGVAELRAAELEALDVVLRATPPLVASVAAGVVLDPSARVRMQQHAFVVYLRATLRTLEARIGSGEGRPWLETSPPTDLARLEAGREALYREVADLVLDVDDASPEALAQQIVAVASA